MTDDRSANDTEPNIKKQSVPRKRIINLDRSLGFLLGLIVSLIIGLVLWMFGVLNLAVDGCPENSTTAACPGTSVAPPICPTCAPAITTPIIEVVTATLTSTPTPTATPTPNLAATATSACAKFESQFPATPCP